MTKLHLGCGRRYLEGYINIDYPLGEQTVQTDLVADKYEDITRLSYPTDSIDEIRLHHVFEHFTRTDALALLCRWREWLKPGGLLRIETPDARAGCKLIASPFTSLISSSKSCDIYSVHMRQLGRFTAMGGIKRNLKPR